MWCVITKGTDGPFGVIAEEFEDGMFRGFFSFDVDVCAGALHQLETTLDCKFDF